MTEQTLDQALAGLQATASQFSVNCIHDAHMRSLYARDIALAANEFREAVDAGRISSREAASQAVAMRNHIMELSRRRTSPIVRAYAIRQKDGGRNFAELSEKYAARHYGASLSSLSAHQQTHVFQEVVRAAGRPDQETMQLAQRIGRIGRRVLLISFAVAVYEIAEAEDKPRELVRQGALAGAGFVGGWMVGGEVVAIGLCAATAPVCVGVFAFAGGLLAAYGADSVIGSMYPRPLRQMP